MANRGKSFQIQGFVLYLLLLAGICSCKEEKVAPVAPAFQTGPATFMALGGVISTFRVIFDELGNMPIEEYGVAYVFAPESVNDDPVVSGTKVIFELPAKVGANEKVVNIGFPAGTQFLAYRAYVKLKGGEVKYAVPVKVIF